MTVLCKYFVTREVKVPAHDRVGEFRCGSIRLSIHETPHQKKFRIASLNLGTLGGRSNEVVETMSRRSVDLCCLQEITWCGASARMIEGKDSYYKIFWVRNKNHTGGASILLSEEWIEKVSDINRVSGRIMLIKFVIDNKIITVLSCYAPEVGLNNVVKDTFYDQLQDTVRKVEADETLVICGDLNGHIGKPVNGHEGVHSGYNYGLRKKEGETYS